MSAESDYADAVSRILLHQGQARAQGALGSGQAWGNFANSLGPIMSRALEQHQQGQAFEKDQQLKTQEIASGKALEQQRLTDVAGKQRLEQTQKTIDRLMAESMKPDETGISVFDRSAFEQNLIKSGNGSQYPAMAEHLDKIEASARQQAAARRAGIAQTVMGIHDLGDTPEALTYGAAFLKKNGFITDQVLTPMLAAASADPSPENIRKLLEQQAAQLPEYRALQAQAAKQKSDLAHVNAETANLGASARKSAAEAAQLETGGKPPTEAELDSQAQKLYSKLRSGATLTPQEAADLAGYQDRKRTISDPAALAATERQNAGIAAATAQQKRAQDFTQLQAARADIEKNVTTPYLTAQNSANTLRDVVTAAQSGNKVAGALQSLETTMAAIRAQGLNRINTAEIGATADAGNLYDRVAGWLGKAKEGQPVDAAIQRDMMEFADILEKAAYQRYLKGHQSSTELYGVPNLKPLAPPASSQKAAAPTTRNPFRK